MNPEYEVIVTGQIITCLFFLGYGQTGPYAQRAGYDVIVSGVGGLITITGPEVRYDHYCFTSFFLQKYESTQYIGPFDLFLM